MDVTLAEEAERLVLEVRDNGQGITEPQIVSTRSIGLVGMRERAALVGGDHFLRRARKGTTVRVLAPLPRAGPGHEDPHRR